MRTPLALSLAAGTVAILMSISPVLAQGQPGGGGQPRQPGQPGGGGRQGGGPGGGMFGGGMGGMFGNQGAPVSTEDVTKIAKMLNMTADQQTAAKALVDGHLATYQSKADEFRKETEAARDEFRESRDPAVFTDMAPKAEAFRKYRTETEAAIMNDIKSLLDAKQAEQWPKVEMARRRESSMRGNPIAISGERADLIAIVEKTVPADKRSDVNPILDQYAIELDRELIKRNAFQEESMGQMGQMGFRGGGDGGAPDMTKFQEMITKGRELATNVREVNRKYAKQISATLPADLGSKFDAEFKKESFPQIYVERYPDRAITAALAMTDLDAGQKDGVTALHEQYTRETKALNEQQEKAAEEFETNFSPDNMRGGFGGFGGNTEEIRTARRELQDSTITKLKAILTPEQAAKLPEQRQGGGGRGGQGMGPGGGGQGGGQGGGNGQRRNRNNNPNNAPTPPKDNNPPAPGKI